MKPPVKQKDLAAALGLSVSTVARALAGSTRIGEQTRERVRAEAERRGYVVDLAARTMRQGTSSFIGFIAPDLQNDFYATAARAVSGYCQRHGLQLVVADTNDDPAAELQHLRNLYSSRVRGLVVIPSVEMSRESRKLLAVMPHVQIVRQCDKLASDWFGIADEEAMRLAVAHLVALGHRRLAFIGSALTISTGTRRLEGFRRALQQHGLDPDSACCESGGCDAEFGHAAMARILARRRRPTAVVTAGARIAAGAYACAREAGVQMPGELSFIGFSDSPAQRWWGDGLTTIALPVEDIATSAMDCLLRRAAEPGRAGTRPMHVMHLPVLVERASTAPPATRQ